MSSTSKTKKNSRKRVKPRICKTCNQDITSNKKRDMYVFKDTYHQMRTKEYCKDHEFTYSDHKCSPSWCGYLIGYEIELKK